MITDEEMHAAIDRIARTADGELFYRWLQLELQRLPLTADQGALLVSHGRRSLASDLMGRMARGLDESGGRTESGSSADRPVVISRAGSVAVARPRGFRRAILAESESGSEPT